MNKKIMRLSEGELMNVIANSVKRIIREDVLGNDFRAKEQDYENVFNNYEPFEDQMDDDNEHEWSTVKEPTVDNTVYESKETKWMKQRNGKYWLTEDGKKVPSTCPQCEAKMNVKIKGEPIFECDNSHYFGTVKFPR